jgi:hypothetical protein
MEVEVRGEVEVDLYIWVRCFTQGSQSSREA